MCLPYLGFITAQNMPRYVAWQDEQGAGTLRAVSFSRRVRGSDPENHDDHPRRSVHIVESFAGVTARVPRY